jgi:hypothetical protein
VKGHQDEAKVVLDHEIPRPWKTGSTSNIDAEASRPIFRFPENACMAHRLPERSIGLATISVASLALLVGASESFVYSVRICELLFVEVSIRYGLKVLHRLGEFF